MADQQDGIVYEQSAEVPVAEPHEENEDLTPEEAAHLAELKGEAPATPAPEEEVELPPEAAKEEETKAEASPEEKPAKAKREVRVPLTELQSERQKRQDFEKKYQEALERQTRADERLRVLQEQWQAAYAQQQQAAQPQPQADPEPDRGLDPLGWQEWWNRQQEARIAYLWQRDQANSQVIAQTREENYIRSSEAEFAQAHPDYFPAIGKLTNHLDALFTPQYQDPGQRRQVIQQYTRNLIQVAMQRGVSPAQMVYEVAKQAGLTEGEAQQAAGEAQQVERATSGRPSMQVARQAQSASRTLSNVTGSPVKPPTSTRELADMSEEEWEVYRETVKGDPLRHAMGVR